MKKMQINKRSPFVAGAIGVVLAVFAAAGLCSKLQAAININSQQTFNALPPVANWSSLSIAGGGGAPVAIADLDIMVQTNTAASINTVLASSTLAAPAQTAQAIWTSGAGNGGLLVTRPTGNAYTILMATITNSTGANFPSPVVSYDFSLPSPLNSEDSGTAGHIVYYSLTGLADSWVKIPELTSAQPTPVAGSLLVTLSLGSWPAGSLLYIIWVDDNGNGATDGSFAIDNFLVSAVIACPTIDQQPHATNNVEGRTVSLSVVASGPGLTYQWNKVGLGAIDANANPSAATPTLVITNAQVSDTGDYFVAVDNSCPNPAVNSANAHVGIIADTFPPVFISARFVKTETKHFILKTDEELCNLGSAVPCIFMGNPVNSLDNFSWHVYQADDLGIELGVAEITMVDSTTYDFRTDADRNPDKAYRIQVDDQQPDFSIVIDTHGNRVPVGTYAEAEAQPPEASFQQGVNGYSGTQDTGLHSGAGIDTPAGGDAIINTDSDDAGIRQALLRFDNIFGPGAGQIPTSSDIVSATLTITQTDPGNVVNFHRMLVAWDPNTATWNSMVGGLDLNNVEVSTTVDAATIGTGQANGPLNLDVTATVRAWAGGQPNYGWAILPTGGDGWRWDTSESGAATAPHLTVEYRTVPCAGLPSITAQPPAAIAANELQPFSITAGVGNACGTLQWTKNGSDIAGANGPTYSVASATPSDAGSYRLRATNPAGSVTSDAAVVTFHPKTSHPHVTRVVNGADGATITVAFSEAVSTASAQSTGNYTLTPVVAVSSAVLGANNTVTLTTAPRTPGTAYSLRIAGVTDIAAIPNPIDPNPTIVSLTSASPVAGAGWADAWLYNTNNLDGTPTWKNTGFVPGGDWLTGNALFGTETSAGVVALFPTPIATEILPNTNTPPDVVSVYFRKSVTLSALGGGAIYILEHFIDDGAVFYWDGVEFGRFNMTNGPVVYSTRAATANEASRQALRLPASASAGGTHTLAVEVHQGGATTSSDIVFGAEVSAVAPLPSLSISHSSGTNTVSWTGDSSWRLVRSAVVTGPYTAVAGNPFHTFVVPPAANTNDAFFMLEFNPAP